MSKTTQKIASKKGANDPTSIKLALLINDIISYYVAFKKNRGPICFET